MKPFTKSLVLLFLLFSLNLNAQDTSKYSRVLTYSQMMEEIINCKEEEYVLEDALVEIEQVFFPDSITTIEVKIRLYDITFTFDARRNFIRSRFFFNNVIFKQDISISMKNTILFGKEAFLPDNNYFVNCRFDGLLRIILEKNSKSNWYLDNCEINNLLYISANDETRKCDIGIINCNIKPINIPLTRTNNQYHSDYALFKTFLNDKISLNIKNSNFGVDSISSYMSINNKVSNITIDSCTFNTDVIYSNLEILNNFKITQSNFIQNVNLQNIKLPNHNLVDFRWEQLSNNLSIFKTNELTSYDINIHFIKDPSHIENYYTGLTAEQAGNSIKYYELTSTYKTLLNIYKNRGDLESQNACYVAMKDMETKRLEYLYKTNKSLESYLYWKLNVFLKFFAKYGTSPVRSVVVSLWVILAFSVIYFFLYSDWDQINRKFLISKHRKLLEYFSSEQKLEDFYADQYKDDFDEYETYKDDLENSKQNVPILIRLLGKPLYYSSLFKHNIMTWVYNRSEILQGRWIDLDTSRKVYVSVVVGISITFYIAYLIIIRLLNSLMLSVNTFSTLGFGNIPVQGGARYIAILEGFLGWFLLSIFSVALISQILQG